MRTKQQPGELVLAEIKTQGYTQAEVATIMGRSPQYINDIVKGKKRIDPLVAVELHEALGTRTPEEWLNLELKYQEAQMNSATGALKRRDVIHAYPFALEAVKQGWVVDSSSPTELQANIEGFLNRADPNVAPYHHRTGKSDALDVSLKAWHIRVMDKVNEQEVPPYNPAKLDAMLRELKVCMRDDASASKVKGILHKYGIRFVIIPNLKKAPVDGVASYNNGHPYIALSLRNAQLDRFWFTLLHECGHIYHKHSEKTAVQLDNIDQRNGQDTFEQEADDYAKKHLLDPQEYADFTFNSEFSLHNIDTFAQQQGVHRSIVIGRLKNDGWLTWVDFAREHPSVRDNLAGMIDR